jgi:hypothetical protein
MPDLDAAQIEHVLPQTLSEEWKQDLGPNAEQIHQTWLDTLGNLSLTGYNRELSNRRFDVKVAGTDAWSGYKDSNFELTKHLAEYACWSEAEIILRGEALAERACVIWRGPEGEDNSNAPGKRFQDGSVIGALYRALSDGQWHQLTELEPLARGKASLTGRLDKLGYRGRKHGLWDLETSGDRVRMIALSKANTASVGA